MKRILTFAASILLALSAWAVSRDYTLSISVSAPAGTLSAGQEFSLYCSPYSVYYPASETKLDADGNASIKVYPGEHVLTIDVKGLKKYETLLNIDSDLSLPIALEEAVENPYSLTYSLSHDIFTGRNDLTLSWNGDEVLFFDDFESYEPFALSWGDWTGIDGDGQFADKMEGDYPNAGACNYGQVMNPLAVTPIWDIKYYWTLAARSGMQYVGFTQNANGSALNDWVITPAITLTTDNQLRFYVKSADVGDAKFVVGITEKMAPTAADFTMIHSGNYISASYDAWTEVIIPLADYAGKTVKIGINCRSSYGSMISMLDDVFVGRPNPESLTRARRVPAKSAANPNETFVITLDGVEVGRTESYSYTFADLQPGSHTLGVKAVYAASESDTETINVVIDPEGYRTVEFEATTDNNSMPEAITLTLSDEDGETYTLTLTDGRTVVQSLPVGRYTLTASPEYYDPYEATIDVTTETSKVNIELKETRKAPFNIIHSATENEDGTYDVALTWNTDLGFHDGFESYDDFATEWGDWITYDFNTQASYPIALDKLSNEISFPGASTSAMRVSVPPMIFNPDKTTPKLSVDEAFLAAFGDKYVMFQGPANAAADKWIISPEVEIYADYEWSIIAKAYTIYPEKIEMCISTGGTSPADFTVVDAFELPYEQWMKYVIDLSEYEGLTLRFAVHCTSYDGFVCQVDEFCVNRKDGGSSSLAGNVLSYDLSLDGSAEVNLPTNTYTLTGVADGKHTVGITANYASGTSERTLYTLTLERSGVEAPIADPADGPTDVFNLQGVKILSGATADDLNRLPAGLYLTTRGKWLKR